MLKLNIGDSMKKGFTLIEVTAVIAILGILAIFVVPKVSTVISNSKKKVCESIRITAEDAAKSYNYLHSNEVETAINNSGYYEVTLLQLQREGLLETDIENPETGEIVSTSNVVKITLENNIYVYTYMGDECK